MAAAKQLMLGLINEARADAGVPPVAMGDNPAAQIHADNSLSNCVVSHWGLDGTTARMRYALAGGYQINAENIIGSNYCVEEGDNYRPINLHSRLREGIKDLMDSPGHRRTILQSDYVKVNLGISWDKYQYFMVQQFEGDYIRYEQAPVIQNKVLTLEGSTANGATVDDDQNLMVDIYHHPFGPLTRNQVYNTYCLDNGTWTASLLPPPSPGHFYTDLSPSVVRYTRCQSPFDVDEDYPMDMNPLKSIRTRFPAFVPWVVADKWEERATYFHVSANIGDVLDQYGAGVYRIVLWGAIDGEKAMVGDYPIFHQVAAPDGYIPNAAD